MIVTICNYDYYQSPKNYENDSVSDNKTTTKRQSNDTINKNDKNDKNGNNILLKDFANLPEEEITDFDKVAFSFYEMFMNHRKNKGISTGQMEKAKLKKWSDPIRLMIEQDKRPLEELRAIWQYLNKGDGFWETTIASTEGVRKHADQILIKSKNNGKQPTGEKLEGITSIFNKHFAD